MDIRYPTALQMVLSLAVADETGVRCTSAELAQCLGANPALVRKLMAPLTRDGILASTMGKNGGVRLGRPAAAITLLDVYASVMEGKPLFVARPDIPDLCVVSRNIGRFFLELASDAEQQVATHLASRTVADSLTAIRAMDMRPGSAKVTFTPTV